MPHPGEPPKPRNGGMLLRRLTSFALALILTLAIATPGLAANITQNGGTANTTFTYTVASNFTVTIPETVTVASGATYGTVALTVAGGSLINAGQNMALTITAATNHAGNQFRLKCGTGTNVYLNYGIKVTGTQSTVSLNTPFVTYTAAQVNTGQTCSLTLTPATATQAGTYTDRLTFTVTVA